MNIINELELKRIISAQNYKNNLIRKDIKDNKLKDYYLYYSFLISNTDDIEKKESREKIIYTIYYWYGKYKKRYFELYGYDAGIEQESFKLLNRLIDDLEQDIDWDIIQRIDEGDI